jgi:hypothetical protein
MVYDTGNYEGLGLCPSSGILKSTKFRKLDLFASSGDGGNTLLGPSERANSVTGPGVAPNPRKERNLVSETLPMADEPPL